MLFLPLETYRPTSVNNSGIGSYGLLENTTFEQIRRVMETNFFGAVRMTQEVIPIMKKQRSGRIINISSTTGIFGEWKDAFIIENIKLQTLT